MRAIRSAVGAAFLAAAISSAQDAKAIPALRQGPTACALLSGPDVVDAVGTRVGEGVTRIVNPDVTSCSFAGERGGQVAILVRRAPASDWVSEQIARMTRGVQFGTYREVPGIGKRSFLYNVRSAGAVLCVFGPRYYLQVSLFHMGEDSRIPSILERLATSALARRRLSYPSSSASIGGPISFFAEFDRDTRRGRAAPGR
jgi:hypothetical protein